jgi:hypothetical protein
MKSIIKFSVCALLAVISFSSCTKDDVKHHFSDRNPSRVDTLAGKEFIFNDLIWEEDTEYGWIYTVVQNRPDLFSKPDRPLEVSLMLDTVNSWLAIPNLSSNNSTGFTYGINRGNASFVVSALSGYIQLVGRKVSVKIKFL